MFAHAVARAHEFGLAWLDPEHQSPCLAGGGVAWAPEFGLTGAVLCYKSAWI